jgi:hypothetical protein|nr:MAG TPA: hypothetical protein [Caudoviricetes sp.]
MTTHDRPEDPEFAYNVNTGYARIGSQVIRPINGIRQETNGYGRHFITLTIPVSCVIVEDDPTGPVNPANPFVTLDR